MFLKKAKAPVFATRGTAEAFEEKNPEYADRLNIFDSGERLLGQGCGRCAVPDAA